MTLGVALQHQIHCFRCCRDPGQDRYHRQGRFEVCILDDVVPSKERKAYKIPITRSPAISNAKRFPAEVEFRNVYSQVIFVPLVLRYFNS